ncbi:MAG: hypothetical protein HPY75_03255 [Actinobacteria bacterium]|nr:hypothetical protein [Actinomycetota bacterium]
MAKPMTRQERLESDKLVELFSGKPRTMYLDFNGKRTRLDPIPEFAHAFVHAFDSDDLFPNGSYSDVFFAGRCPRKRFLAWARRSGIIPEAQRGQEAGWGQFEWLDALYGRAKIWPDGVPATIAVVRRPRGDVFVFGVYPESRLSAERERFLESWWGQ